MSMRKFSLLVLTVVTFAAGMQGGRSVSYAAGARLEYRFSGAGSLKGWAVTKTATAVARDDYLEVQGRGNDAKIYRVINLPPGRYVVSGLAAEKTRIKILKPDWRTVLLDFNLSTRKDASLAGRDGWRSDYLDFVTDGGALFLTVEVYGDVGAARIKALNIEAAPRERHDSGTPSPGSLASETARLPIVRGFTTGYLGPVNGHLKPTDGNVFRDMRAYGANVARLDIWPSGRWKPMANDDFWKKGLPALLDYIESNVALARQAGVKVILDCHYPPPVGGKLHDHGTDAFWKNPETAASMCRLWKAIAERMLPYRDTIYGYDLFNEPLDRGQLPRAPREWRPMAVEILKAVRSVDRNVWVIYEPGPGGLVGGFRDLVPLPDTRVIYSPHFYYPFEFCAQGVIALEGTDLQKAMVATNVHYPLAINGIRWDKARLARTLADVEEFQRRWKVPIYVGEFSVIRWAPRKDAVQWLIDVIDLFEARGWSWTYHAFRENTSWSLEHDETYRAKGEPTPAPVLYETERAKVVKKALAKNWLPR
jgi:endoglucanase